MTRRHLTRIGLGLGGAALAVALGAPFVAAQDRNTNGAPPSFMGRHGGPDGPRGFGRGGPGRGGPGRPGRGGPGPMLRGVDLTEDQRAQVRTILEASREKLRADVLNVLTDEQKAQAAERESRFRDRRDPRP